MKIVKFHLLIALFSGIALLTTACQKSQQAMSFRPAAQANAPASNPSYVKTASTVAATKTPAQDPAAHSPLAPAKADPVADLVSSVEKEFQAGETSLAAKDGPGAKQHFDDAFNLLMNSKLDLNSDARLKAEYDKVSARVNSVELQALDQPDDSSSQTDQKSEPAPIDEVNETTPAVDPNVKAKAEAEVKATHSDLPLMLTDPVAGYINYFSGRGRGTLETALERGGRYQAMIEKILKEEGVPQDLIYLAQAESGFHPLAVSRAGARGMWQFMGSRAKAYGLKHNSWVDERQDPEKSTRAAAHHLKDLYNQFGDWYLAMAAYNSGPGTVQQAVKRTGYADFWELYNRNVLPKETRNYVPIIVAMTIMAKNPAQYGLQDIAREEPLAYDTVKVDYPIDLRLVAQCVDVPPATIQELNPSLLRWATPKDGTFDLHIPKGSKNEYMSAVALIPENMRVWWRYYDVADGDTLASIGRKYHVTSEAIEKANHLDSGDLSAESKLVIPIAPGRLSAGDVQSYARRITRYHVHRGDTVEKVAANFGVPTTMVRRWNHLRGNSLQGRHVLYLHLPVMPKPDDLQRVMAKSRGRTRHSTAKSHKTSVLASNQTALHHRVKPGETLYSIATTYNTTVTALKHDNRIADALMLRPGMILIIR